MADDRGQVVPMMLLFVALTVALAFGLVRWGSGVVAEARAQTAADAAVLAGVTEGHRAAVELAEINGGTLVEFSRRYSLGRAVVVVDGRRAVATAELAKVDSS